MSSGAGLRRWENRPQPASPPAEVPDRTAHARLTSLRQRHPDLIGVWLFGSRAQGLARPDSDIDLAILAPAPLDPVAVFDSQLALADAANTDVDLIDLRRAPTVLRKEIVTAGALVWAADPAACEAFASDAVFVYVASRDELELAARDLHRARR